MSSPKSQTVTSKTEPWKEAKPYFTGLYNKAVEAFNSTNKQTYGGDLWAGPTARQTQANDALANNQWGQGAQDLRQLGTDTAQGKYLSHETNPYLKGAVDTAAGDITRRYTESVLPALGSAAQRAGAYGGSRQGIVDSQAAGEYGREANEAAQNIYYQNYAAERDRQMNAGGLFNQANNLEQQQIQGLAGAGEQEQKWQQGQLGENYQKYQMEQAAPWAGIPELLSVLTGGSFQSSSSTGPNPNYMNPMQTAMGAGSLLTGLMDAFKTT